MKTNPYAADPACPTCNDIRTVTVRVEARKNDLRKCPACGNFNDETYERFRAEAWVKVQKPPTISQLDITPEELIVYRRTKEEHPSTSSVTVLTWIEGQRYDPAKDEDFLREAREHFRKWKDRP